MCAARRVRGKLSACDARWATAKHPQAHRPGLNCSDPKCRQSAQRRPRQRFVFPSAPEDLDFGMRKVLSNLGGDFQELIIRDSSYAVLIVHEFQVVDERAKLSHPGKDGASISNPVSVPFSRM